MAKIVRTTDFTGVYAISQSSFNTADLQAFIDKFELSYLKDMLGVTLANLLYADIAPSTFLPPVTARHATIFNALSQDEPLIISNGIKEMLKGFIYFEFVRTQSVHNTIAGNVIAANEVSVQADWNSTNCYSNYNSAIRAYKNIQEYILLNSSTYPEFKGVSKSFTSDFM